MFCLLYTSKEIARDIIKAFFTDYTDEEMQHCVDGAYDSKFEEAEIVPVKEAGGAYFLELYHGKTAAFKDMALSILPYLLTTAMKKEKEDKKDVYKRQIIGYVSDNTDTRFGKRKPFLVIASLPLMVFTSLFFFNVHAGEEVMIVYYGIMIMLFWTSFSFFFVPYLAWGAELTDNYDERTVLRGYVSFFNAVGTALGLVLPNILVEIMTDAGYSVETGWQTTGILCGVV